MASTDEVLDEGENIDDEESSDEDGGIDDEEAPNEDEDSSAMPKTKNWNLPKKHVRKHVFANIEDKGVSRNSGTKINEGMHGPLKTSYHDRTNFKNFGDQVYFLYHFKEGTISDFL